MKTKLAFILILSLGLISCQFLSQLPGKKSPTSAPPGAPVVATNVEGEAATPDSKEQPEIGSGLLPNPAAGLDRLSSYHQELSISFNGKVDGQPHTWVNTYVRDFWKTPEASFLLFTTSETGREAQERLFGSLDQARYQRSQAGGPCKVTWGGPAEGPETSLNPAGMLQTIQSAVESGQEQVNGVSSRHFQFTDKTEGGTRTGEVWLAVDGGYVTRYQLFIQGDESIFGKGIEGEQRFTYELTQVNGLPEPTPPQGCPVVNMDFPVMDGAQNLNRQPNGVDYTSQAGADAVSQFYQDQLNPLGWNLISEHKSENQKTVLVFVNEGKKQRATILLDGSSGKVWVSALLQAWEPAP